MKTKNIFSLIHTKNLSKYKLPLSLSIAFFFAYLTLGVVKHLHFLSGYDLAIVDQVVWRYSRFLPPITTIHSYTYTSLLADHVEIIYILLAPFYWIFNNALTLILLQALVLSFSGIPVYLLARLKNIPKSLSLALLATYLSFYGIQNALWSDVHSLVFAAGILPWFIYFLYTNKTKWIYISLFLALICKEDIGFLTFFIALVFFIAHKSKHAIFSMLISGSYIFTLFFIYYPFFTTDGYRYASEAGLLANLNLQYLWNTSQKQEVYLYSLGWFGFLPLLGGYLQLPALADLFHYFVLGQEVVTSAQGIFLHYRSTLAILLVWPTIIGLAWFIKQKISKYISVKLIAVYLLLSASLFQYLLHAPLSYLAKSWFWEKPAAVSSINAAISRLPKNASVATQINIAPHLTHRENIFTLWPEVKGFPENSPCGNPECRFIKWRGNPEYLLVDLSSNWDIRHFLANREDFISGINNLEKLGYIEKLFTKDNTFLFKVIKQSP